jgi:hypothetical protein
MATASNAELAAARALAAERLEAAFDALGVAYGAYVKATNALEFRTNEDLARYLEVPITLHLVRAGLGPFLERRLTGTAAPLRALVETQHRRSRAFGLRDT